MNFKDNPFWLLDASPRDPKRVLHDKAEDKSFELPEDVCRNAENILVTPKRRLEAELAWFPGTSPKRVKELLLQIRENAEEGVFYPEAFSSLRSLSRANALALLLADITEAKFDKEGVDKEAVKEFVWEFCMATSEIDPMETLDLINGDRIASGFSEIQHDEAFTQGLQDMRRFYKQILHDFLDFFDSSLIVEALTELIENATNLGKDECEYPLLDDIISDYEVYVTPFFDKQEEKIFQDIDEIRQFAVRSPSAETMLSAMDKMEKDVRLWDKVAQPLQVLSKSKGMEHKRSSSLANKLRELAITVHNDHGLTELSERISRLLSEVFAEVPIVAETVSEDLKFLRQSIRDKKTIEKITCIVNKYFYIPNKYSPVENLQQCLQEALPVINGLQDVDVAKNFLASLLLQYVIEHANREKKFLTCIELMKKIRPLITDRKLLTRFLENNRIIRQNFSNQIQNIGNEIQISLNRRKSSGCLVLLLLLPLFIIMAIIKAALSASPLMSACFWDFKF